VIQEWQQEGFHLAVDVALCDESGDVVNLEEYLKE